MDAGMGKVRLQDPTTGRFVWVESSAVGSEAPSEPAAPVTRNQTPASPAESASSAAPAKPKKRSGFFDDDDQVDDWDLDDL